VPPVSGVDVTRRRGHVDGGVAVLFDVRSFAVAVFAPAVTGDRVELWNMVAGLFFVSGSLKAEPY